MAKTVYDPSTSIYAFAREGQNSKGKDYKPAVYVEHPAIIGGRSAIRIDAMEALADFAKDATGKLTPERALKTLQAIDVAAQKAREARGGTSHGPKPVAGRKL